MTEAASAGTDVVEANYNGYTLGSNLETLVLGGATTVVSGVGNVLANSLVGNAVDNTLDGGLGADTLSGGAGNDTYLVDNVLDVVVETAANGTADIVQSSVSGYTLGANVEFLTLIGTVGAGVGNSSANTITGNASANTLDGGVGADSLVGAAGNDYYVVDLTLDSVYEVSGEGADSVEANVSGYTLANEVEVLILDGTIGVGTGNTMDNRLVGNSASNTLDGGTGADTLGGGSGNDYYLIDDSTDRVVEESGAGTDVVTVSFNNYSLAANVENLVLTGTSALAATGNSFGNSLQGTSSDNSLDGGAGNDTLNGGAGNDTYIVDSVNDVVVEGVGTGTADIILANVSGYTLASGVESLVLLGSYEVGTGNSVDNSLTGNAVANTLNGGLGNDTLVGLAGNDFYVLDNSSDVVVEASGGGNDTATIAFNNYSLAPEVENLILSSTTAMTAMGNTMSNSLTGNTAGNTLDGNGGTDTLVGMTGSDYYIIDGLNDVVVEASGAGTDSVLANISNYTLVANVEVLQLGSGIVRGVGNASANTLVGSAENNILYGAAGKDSLNAGAGDDTLAGALVEISGGKGEIDTLTGGGGNDLFILGFASGSLYNDGSAKAAGTSDYALITDFITGTDQIQLDGIAGNYLTAGYAGGMGLYLKENGSVDELIAIFTNSTLTKDQILAGARYV